MGSVKATLQDESLQKRFCKQVTIGPPSSRMPMIIVGVAMYVKPMCKRSTVSGPLHPIPPWRPFEKCEIDLMGPLPMIRKGHWFIIVTTDYLIKFVKVRALKSLVKHEITRFLYEWIFTRFGTPLETVSNSGPQFLSEVVENLLARLVVKYRFTTMYKPNINGLVERTNTTLCSMLAKEAKVHVNICD